MDFRLTSDQIALLAALDRVAVRFLEKPIDFHGFALVGEELAQQLTDGEFFDIARTPGLGPVGAALAVERLARLPYTTEVALSMLVRPHVLGGHMPRPFALVEQGRPGRFVESAQTLLFVDGETLGVALAPHGGAQPVESMYAYPMAKLVRKPEVKSLSSSEAAEVRTWLRIALAAEAAGLMQAALDSTVAHLGVRKQFGRPLGTFQALRHRVAECAVLAGGVKWLALKAASTGDAGDAALAAFHAQDCANRVVYDLHQMLGAMGMTLEHPLHLWTYRLKSLISDLGGRGAQADAVSHLCFTSGGAPGSGA
jgi:hypothetical protein